MTPEPPVSQATRTTPQARAVRARQNARSRIATTRAALIGGVAAATCALAVFIGSVASGASTASVRTSASGPPGSVQPLFGRGEPGADNGGGTSRSFGGSAPGASSGEGDATSGGS
jgi:hypothetical protein